jgi:hypothetical protein
MFLKLIFHGGQLVALLFPSLLPCGIVGTFLQMIKKHPMNTAGGGLCRTILSGYYKMHTWNIVLTEEYGTCITAVMIEYE